MTQNRPMSLRSALIRLASIALVSAILGAFIGVGQAYAETLYNVSVPGAGNVATAGTTGYSSGGTSYATGRSTSTVTLYHIFGGVRFWHQSTEGNIISSQSNKNWYNSKGGYTNQIATVGYGDKATTRSTFRWNTSYHSSIYYTSWPNYSASCSAAWYYGDPC
jgi:hypothetical protein